MVPSFERYVTFISRDDRVEYKVLRNTLLDLNLLPATTTGDGVQAVMISVIVPVHNGTSFLRQCLEALGGSRCPYECIVVNDGSTDETSEIAGSFPTRVIDVPDGPRGPAYARNRAAEVARGDILFFLDADVIVDRDTLERIERTFVQHPEVDAVFGSYDDRPAETNFVSLYKNLAHHFVHQHGAGTTAAP